MFCVDFGFGKGIGVIGCVWLIHGARIDKICLISIHYLIKHQGIVRDFGVLAAWLRGIRRQDLNGTSLVQEHFEISQRMHVKVTRG